MFERKKREVEGEKKKGVGGGGERERGGRHKEEIQIKRGNDKVWEKLYFIYY